MTANIFNTIPLRKPKRNAFNLTHDVKFSGKMGSLIPVCFFDGVPGDSFTIGADLLVKFAPMLAPIMHRVDASVHYFAIPYRLLWDGWEDFITNTNPDRVMPTIKITSSLTTLQKKFMDYLGIPPMTGSYTIDVNAFYAAAYQFVYNEYYRDQNLIQEVTWKLQDGDNSANPHLFTMRKRAWERDYFTSALPFPQKGAVVTIPMGDVQLKPDYFDQPSGPFEPRFLDENVESNPGVLTQQDGMIRLDGDTNRLAYDPDGSLMVTAANINEFRRALKLQEWFEKNARGGTRYSENIWSHFVVRSADARLQRPEYITGIKTPVIISEVLNNTGSFDPTTDEPTSAPQGSMTGHGTAVLNGSKYGTYFCQEHMVILGLMSVMPKTAYQDGVSAHYLKRDFLDYYWPSFAHLGEQPIKGAEIYANTDAAHQNGTFGYTPRYAEYKFIPSRIAGDFRNSLEFWHLGRKFSGFPSLNQSFIEMQTDLIDQRVFAVQDGTDNLWCHVLNKIKAVRPMPIYGTPSL